MEMQDFYLPKSQDIVQLEFWNSLTFLNFKTISVYIDVNFICIWYAWGQNVMFQNLARKNPGNACQIPQQSFNSDSTCTPQSFDDTFQSHDSTLILREKMVMMKLLHI